MVAPLRRRFLEALAEKITASYDRRVEVLAADLGKEADLAPVEHVLSSNPEVRVLVNNAGLARLAPFAKSPLQDSLDQIAVNVTALTRLTHAALPGFVARNQGSIINIASALGIYALPVSSVYSATKSFVLTFSRGLQDELAGTNVKVQVVLPAATATEVWDNSGVPLATFDPSVVMTTENLVDAALAGFYNGETVTWPSVADDQLWKQYDAARSELFTASQTGEPAPRYTVAAAA